MMMVARLVLYFEVFTIFYNEGTSWSDYKDLVR